MTSAGHPRRRGWHGLLAALRKGKKGPPPKAAPGVFFSHRRSAAVRVLGWRLDFTAQDRARVTRSLAALAGGTAAACGGTVGCLRVVPGEEPVVFSLAARIDLVAESVMRELSAGTGRRLWIVLEPGVYLAEVVDPLAPFGGSDEEIEALAARAGVRCVLALLSEPRRGGARLVAELFGRVDQMPGVLASARPSLRAARDELAASSNAPAAPKTRVKTRL